MAGLTRRGRAVIHAARCLVANGPDGRYTRNVWTVDEPVEVTIPAPSGGCTDIVQLVSPLGRGAIRIIEHLRLKHAGHWLARHKPHCLILLALIGVHAGLPRHRDAR